jgi:dienelactone hydrolase/TfoX/Sxy family transcriptional regulator of competence genes
MAKEFTKDLKALLEPTIAALPSDVVVEVRHFFSGAAAYVNGRVCLTLTPVGLAMKLPEDDRARLIKQGAKPLRYFPKGPVKKQYVLCPPAFRDDPDNLAHWARRAIDHALSLPGPQPKRRRLATALAWLLIGVWPSGVWAAGEAVRFASVGRHETVSITATLYRPAPIDRPSSAVVLLHGCSGVTSLHHIWAKRLSDWGHAALVVDSLGPRSVDEICSAPGRVPVRKRIYDAYGALAFLKTQPGIDPERIAIAGWSHGGWTLLHAIRANSTQVMDMIGQFGGFRAAVAFYPFCDVTDVFDTPLLILIGGADDWTPASLCRGAVTAARQMNSPAPVAIKVYPGAVHGYDDEWSADPVRVGAWARGKSGASAAPGGGLNYFGHLLKFDPDALADTLPRVEQFLATHLETDAVGD